MLALLVAGCATSPPGADHGPPPGAEPGISEYPVWQLRGRVSLVRENQGWHAGMNWREAYGWYRLSLFGPLGQGAVEVEGEAAGLVRLRTADGHEHMAHDADALVESATGWRFPVSGIRYWVRGAPAPDGHVDRAMRDERGRLLQLEQAGWDIRYTRYESVDGRDWPTRLQLSRTDLSVRLVIDEWIVSRSTDAATSARP